MFDGWLSFGGAEIVNRSRVQAYIENMLPSLKTHHVCSGECACDTLAALLEDKDYTTPMIDDAPWTDIDRVESFDFLGVYPLGITGLTDSTVTATVLDSMDDGGWITSRRRRPREIRVSVATFAMSDAAANYGTQWLKSVLDGACGDGCYARDQLCFLTECVDPAEFQGIVRRATHGLSEWSLFRAGWESSTLVLREQESYAELEVRDSCGDVEWEIQLQGTDGDQFLIIQDDRVDTHTFDGSLQTFRATTQGTSVRLAVPDVSDLASWGVPTPPEEDETLYAHHIDTSEFIGTDVAHAWAHVTTIPLRMRIAKVTTTARYALSQSECAEEFYRFVKRVANTEGPRIREVQYPAGGGVITYLDFVLTAESPWIYGATVEAAAGSSSGIVATAVPYRVVRLTKNVPECTAPKDSALLLDPKGPVTPAPPRAAANDPDPLREEYAFSVTSRPYALIIPADVVPQWLSVVPVVRITAGAEDVRFVSVRFFPMPYDSIAAEDIDPCSQCGSFEISYIPKGQTFEVDGTEERAVVITGGGVEQDALHLVTAPGGVGAMTWPALSCGVAYMVIVDSHEQALSRIQIDLAVRE